MGLLMALRARPASLNGPVGAVGSDRDEEEPARRRRAGRRSDGATRRQDPDRHIKKEGRARRSGQNHLLMLFRTCG